MKKTTWLRRVTVAASTILVTCATVFVSTAAAAPAGGVGPVVAASQASPAQASCTVTDGRSRTGQQVGSNPVRYRYPDSPYLGARFDRCTGKIHLYYGGVRTDFYTHYNIRWGTNQYEARMGANRRATFNDPGDPRPGNHGFIVQACRDTPIMVPDYCTRWSPQVQLPRR